MSHQADITSCFELVPNINSARLGGLGLNNDVSTYLYNIITLINRWREQS